MIHGHVTYKGQHMSSAMVNVWYGATSMPSHMADKMMNCNAEGEYKITGLRKGDYYLQAEAQVTEGGTITTRTDGGSVTVDKKSGEFDKDFDLK